MTTESPHVTIHIFGAAKGESIVLELPGGGWGVVDCYARSLNDPATNPTIVFLRERGVRELEFLCLTHPHDDHFRGMSQILEEFPVDYFWHFGAQSAAHFKQLVDYIRFEGESEGTEDARERGPEFQRIWSLVEQQRSAGTTRLKASSPMSLLYPVPGDLEAPFRIFGLAPSGNQASRYMRVYSTCFDESGRFKPKIAQVDHNVISVALLLVYGTTRIILGGDVKEEGWLDALEEVGGRELAAHLVKVSHHGSTNGYCDGLWQHFASTGSVGPHAIVTSYLAQGLPRRKALDQIRLHARSILLTCGTAIRSAELPTGIDPGVSRSRLALMSKMGELRNGSGHACGRWSLSFDDQGNCLSCEATAPACNLLE